MKRAVILLAWYFMSIRSAFVGGPMTADYMGPYPTLEVCNAARKGAIEVLSWPNEPSGVPELCHDGDAWVIEGQWLDAIDRNYTCDRECMY